MAESGTMPVTVLCTDASGAPAFYLAAVTATREEIHNGDHYDKAKALAEEAGYDAPMIAFDPTDPAAAQLTQLGNAMAAARHRAPAPPAHDVPEIASLLTLSTTHMRNPQVLIDDDPMHAWLDAHAISYEYGWFIPLPPPEHTEDAPAELRTVFDYARQRGCDFLRFDADGPCMEDLPQLWIDPAPPHPFPKQR